MFNGNDFGVARREPRIKTQCKAAKLNYIVFFSPPRPRTSDPRAHRDSNEEAFVSTSSNDSLAADTTGCEPSQKYAIIVHGWRESCSSAWAKLLRQSESLSIYSPLPLPLHTFRSCIRANYGTLQPFNKVLLSMCSGQRAQFSVCSPGDRAHPHPFAFRSGRTFSLELLILR